MKLEHGRRQLRRLLQPDEKRVANHEISSHPAIRQGVREALDRDYDGSVKVRHLIEALLEDVGLPTINKSLKRSLNGLKVACYYGCLRLVSLRWEF